MNEPQNVLRILYLNGWSSCHGGSSTSLLDIIRSLDRNRFEPQVLCPEPGPLPDRLMEMGIPVTTRKIVAMSKENMVSFVRDMFWHIRFLQLKNIDLVHANTGCWRGSIVVACRWLKIPYLQHVRNPLKNFQSDFSLKLARQIIVNSNDCGKELLNNEKFRDKTITIYNSVDLSLYNDAKDDRRDEINADNRPVIGFVGQLTPRKGTITLIQALPQILKQFPDTLLVIVGRPPENECEYEEECKNLVNDFQLTRNVKFMGFRRDVPAWMRTFDVFALPTRSEPFGKVIIEAMAAGCPVVSTRVGGIPEIITRADLGSLVTPDDPAAIASEIIKFLSDSSRRKKIGNSAQQYVREKFSLKTMINNLSQLYSEVTSNNGKIH